MRHWDGSAAGDRLGRRRPGRDRPGLLGRVHRLPAQGALACRAHGDDAGGSPRRHAHIEIDVLGEPVGKQDQYVAAHGGICAYTFHPDDR